MDIFDCVDLKRQQLLDVLVNNGVDLDDPNAFIIDEFEGVTGDWSVVSNIIDYLENGEVEEFGIDQQGFAAKRLKVKRVNDAFVYSLFDEDGQPLHDTVQDNHNTDIVDYDDEEDDDEYDYDCDDEDEPDQGIMELDFAELQRYLTACTLAALDAHDEQDWHGENWWNDKALLAKRHFLNIYGLSWSDYDKLEQEYKRQK